MTRLMRRQIEVDDDDQPYVVIEKHEGSVGSFFVGLAVGAGIALLFAPRSGVETRQAIGDGARRVKDRASDIVEDAAETVTDTFDAARARVEERIDSVRSAVELKKRQVLTAVDAGRAAAEQAREELERRIAETKAAYRHAGEAVRVRPSRPRASGGLPVAAVPGARARGRAGTPGGAGDRLERVAEDAEDTE
jgi:gas vesicle protein